MFFSVIFNFRHGSNDMRLITGLFAGSMLPFLVFPLFNRLLHSEPKDEKIMDSIFPLLFIIIADIIIFSIIRTGCSFLFWPYFIVCAAGNILVYLNLNALFLLFFFNITGYYRSLNIHVVNFYAFIFSFMELYAVYLLYKFLGIK